MSDLKVDYYALEDSVTALSSVKSELDGLEHRTDDTESVWGHNGVKDAMHEFSHNMDYNRRKLTEKVDETGQKMSSTLEAFRKAEDELCKAFDKEKPK